MSRIIEINSEQIEENNILSEELAHNIIANKVSVLMIFERPDGTKYGYEATGINDLVHAKKVTINNFIGFYNMHILDNG